MQVVGVYESDINDGKVLEEKGMRMVRKWLILI